MLRNRMRENEHPVKLRHSKGIYLASTARERVASGSQDNASFISHVSRVLGDCCQATASVIALLSTIGHRIAIAGRVSSYRCTCSNKCFSRALLFYLTASL
ncbi:hypothetical protein NDU88_005462 [Pleurodeles waltl]|uniref:Uncharacterized protein n=1 Tax=Pleurodeles waltl TaxID=8319 RepID=A0AAV7SLZ3_PLEWA|nr:hypothetical protein NDU88_005462 [Pleurodeles waltl]